VPTTAYALLREHFGIEEAIYKIHKKQGGDIQDIVDTNINKLLSEHDLIVSPTDDHWSPTANKWVFDNYIMPKAIDILSEK
jgi:hypothetical protein